MFRKALLIALAVMIAGTSQLSYAAGKHYKIKIQMLGGDPPRL